jgi:hypothetical protein
MDDATAEAVVKLVAELVTVLLSWWLGRKFRRK